MAKDSYELKMESCRPKWQNAAKHASITRYMKNLLQKQRVQLY